MSRASRKAARLAARAHKRAAAADLAVIPHDKERNLKLIILARRPGMPDWRVLQRLPELNYSLQEGKITVLDAQRQADFVAARWQAQNMHEEIRVHWRYGAPLQDLRHLQALEDAKATRRKPAPKPADPRISRMAAQLDRLFS